MILFLDFDGVLHPGCQPASSALFFCHLPRLLSVLDDFPLVSIVVSSSWRTLSEAEWLEVPGPLRARISGETPVIQRPVRTRYPVNYVPEPIRYREILKYLRGTKQKDRAWIALDDDPTLFPIACPQLLICRDGFQEAEEIALRRVLADMWS